MYKLAVALLLVCSTLCHASPVEKLNQNAPGSVGSSHTPSGSPNPDSTIVTNVGKEGTGGDQAKASETHSISTVQPSSVADNKATTVDPATSSPNKSTTPDATTTATTTTSTTTTTTTTPKPAPITSTTTTTPKPEPTTTHAPPTTHPPSPAPTHSPTTITPPTSTAQPKPSPSSGGFNLISFLGGMILGLGLLAIGYVVFKFYQTRRDSSYRTL